MTLSESITTTNRQSGLFVTIIQNVAVLVGLFLTSFYSYLLFHSLIEIFTVVVAFTFFILAWNTRQYSANSFLKILGIGYAFCAGIDFLHTLAYKGMNIFHDGGANLPTQLWIAARCLQATVLVLALGLKNRKVNDTAIITGFSAAVLLLLLAVFGGHFPDCFIEGKGLTSFKIHTEYAISMLLTLCLAILYQSRKQFEDRVARLVIASVVCSVLSEVSFTQYVSVFGPANMWGHFFKLAAFYFIYRSILVTGLQEPFAIVFRDLKQTQEALSHSVETLEERVHERTSDLRLAEERVRRLNEKLEERVRQRTAQLEAANRELESFSYSVSHDLRAPIRHISAFSTLLLEEHGVLLPKDARTLIERIGEGAVRMGKLIDGLLDFSRLGRKEIHIGDVSLDALVKEVVEELTPDWAGRHVEWKISPLPTVRGDPSLLRQVFLNLIANALKFSRNHSPAIITIGETFKNAERALYVHDNGAGFDMQYADKLFRPFQRLHPQEEFEGTGIGLATVRRIVQRHGGRIWAEAQRGEGATFFFTCASSAPELSHEKSWAEPCPQNHDLPGGAPKK